MTDPDMKKRNPADTTCIERFRYAGFDCIILKYKGFWNGYITVPKSHLLFNKIYYEIDVSVVGGIDYDSYRCPATWERNKDRCFYGFSSKDSDEPKNKGFIISKLKNMARQFRDHKGYRVAVESSTDESAIRVFHNNLAQGDNRPIIHYELAEAVLAAIKTCNTAWKPEPSDNLIKEGDGVMARLPITIFEITPNKN